MTPRRWFHLLLGAIFIPCLSLPLVWGVAIYWLPRAVDEQARRWARRVVGLAVLDTMVVVAAGVLVADRLDKGKVTAVPVPDRVVIGVMTDVSFSGPGLRVESISPGGPAAAVGIQVGDIIDRVAEKEVNSAAALRTVVGEQTAGVPVMLETRRGASTRVVKVTPLRSSQLPLQKVGLFEPSPGRHACFVAVEAPRLAPWIIILAGIALVGVLAARRGQGRGVWLTGLSLAGAGAGTYAAYGGTCVLLGGPTAAGGVFALWGSSLGLAATALVARRFVGNGEVSPPTTTWAAAVGIGGWYAITGWLRLAILLSAVIQLVPGGAGFNPVASLGQGLGSMSGPGFLLLALPVILFAPVGEELAFRGLLLPSLSEWMCPTAAVAVTSVIFASLHWYYGLMLPWVAYLGAVLGWARVASGGIRASILLHMLVNGIGLVPVLLKAMRVGCA